MIYKRIASICFALAFICALGVFTDYFLHYISRSEAKMGILIFGAIAFLMNLLAYRFDDSSNSSYNLLFWIGSIVMFIGIIMKIQQYRLSFFVIIAGILIVGLSYLYNPFAKSEDKSDDLLDN